MSLFAGAAIVLEIAFALAGIRLLWQLAISPAGRAALLRSPLPEWKALPSEFLFFLLFVVCGVAAGDGVTSFILKRHPLKGDDATLLSGAAGQLGLLLSVAIYSLSYPAFRTQAKQSAWFIFRSGFATFLVCVPLLAAVSKLWELLLDRLGVPAERQDLIRMFIEADSLRSIATLTVLAIAVAPVAEELVFRAGIFRFMRTRTPRTLAVMLPALIFASLHVNPKTLDGFASFAPLLVLAIVFSLAYERTGHIGTTMVAHGLFNLNTIVLIYAGVGT
jgi:membrane protease YdiL (CAAX protease family)